MITPWKTNQLKMYRAPLSNREQYGTFPYFHPKKNMKKHLSFWHFAPPWVDLSHEARFDFISITAKSLSNEISHAISVLIFDLCGLVHINMIYGSV